MANVNIIQAGLATQFGQPGVDPTIHAKRAKPWSIKMAVRYLIRQKIDYNDPMAIHRLLPARPSLAELLAANMLQRALKGDIRAVKRITDMVDGKLKPISYRNKQGCSAEMSLELLDELINAKLDIS